VLTDYASRVLRPAEVLLLARYREAFSRRVLEIGCGAGRILGYLIQLGADAHGIDVSQEMVDYCRLVYPEADVTVADVGALHGRVEGPFDVVLAADNVLDVFDDSDRRRVLTDLRALIVPGGLLVFSSHNLYAADVRAPAPQPVRALLQRLIDRPLGDTIRAVPRIPRRIRNRRAHERLQYRAAGYAVLNDSAHDYALLHYYIRREDQARQLAELGYELVECLDVDGRQVGPGEGGRGSALYYVALVCG
jgi:SAM-dependent methyltransferase